MIPQTNIPDGLLDVALEDLSLRSAIELAGILEPHKLIGWLLFLASKTQRNTNQLLEELRRMATNDASLTQAVTDLTNAFQANSDAITAEIANIRAANTPTTDPAITDAVSKIETLVSQMNQATAAAQAAIAPPASSGDTTSSTGAQDNASSSASTAH